MTTWGQIGLDINGDNTGDLFGSSVKLSANGFIFAIGAYQYAGVGTNRGLVRVYEWNGTAWMQKGNDLIGLNDNEFFGISIALSDDGLTLAVGAPYTVSENGEVFVYKFDGSNYVLQEGETEGATIKPDNTRGNGLFGRAIAMSADGCIIAVGAYLHNTQTGFVQVFECDTDSSGNPIWVLREEKLGSSIRYLYGYSVALSEDGSTLAVGSIGSIAVGSTNTNGTVIVYGWDGLSYVQVGNIIEGDFQSDTFGASVSLSNDGSILAVSADTSDIRDPSGNIIVANTGLARVYEEQDVSGNWIQKGADLNGESAGDRILSVSLSGDGSRLAFGSEQYDTKDVSGNVIDSNIGRVQVYDWNGSAWIQVVDDIVGQMAGDRSGFSVSLSDDRCVVASGSLGYVSDTGQARAFYDTILCPTICLHENTIIKTSKGNKQIKDIRSGDTVYDMNGSQMEVIHNIRFTITNTYISIAKDAFKYNVPNNEVLITSGHPISLNGEEVQPRDMINDSTIKYVYMDKSTPIYSICTKGRQPIQMHNMGIYTWCKEEWEQFKAEMGPKLIYKQI